MWVICARNVAIRQALPWWNCFTVTTAVAMTPEQKERLRSALEQKLRRTVRITERIERSILGGVIVQYGDTRIDNSVKFRLDALKEQLS